MTAIAEFLGTILGRVIAAWIAGLATFLMTKYGVLIDAEQQKHLVEYTVGLILPLFITIYSILHKVLNKKLNPGDAASVHIAEQEKTEHSVLTRSAGR